MEINKDEYLKKFSTCKKVVCKYEFQELCSDLEKVYKTKAVWSLPCKVGYTESKIRAAHKICQQKGITKINYLIGVINRLK